MSAFLTCFDNRSIVYNTFGEQLVGPSVDIQWFGLSADLSYYSFFNLILMVLFILIGYWKSEWKLLSFKRLTILLWQLSITLVAFSVTISGLTRLTLFWATFHSISEFVMLYAIIFNLKKRINKKITIGYFAIGGIYFFLELILALVAPLDASYFIVAGMGAPVDFTTFTGWIVMFRFGKIKFFPMLAFLLHIVYIIMLFMNCFVVPWGRIVGLGLNTMAIFFASMPVNNNSWRFIEFIHNQKKAKKQKKLPTQMNKPAEDSEKEDSPEDTEDMSDW